MATTHVLLSHLVQDDTPNLRGGSPVVNKTMTMQMQLPPPPKKRREHHHDNDVHVQGL